MVLGFHTSLETVRRRGGAAAGQRHGERAGAAGRAAIKRGRGGRGDEGERQQLARRAGVGRSQKEARWQKGAGGGDIFGG